MSEKAKYLSVNFIIFCRDAVVSREGDISFLRLIEQARPATIPVTFGAFHCVVEFARNPEIPISEFKKQKLKAILGLKLPTGEELNLAESEASEIDEKKPWQVFRMDVDLSGSFKLKAEGDYIFSALIDDGTQDYKTLATRTFNVKVAENESLKNPLAEETIPKKQKKIPQKNR